MFVVAFPVVHLAPGVAFGLEGQSSDVFELTDFNFSKFAAEIGAEVEILKLKPTSVHLSSPSCQAEAWQQWRSVQ